MACYMSLSSRLTDLEDAYINKLTVKKCVSSFVSPRLLTLLTLHSRTLQKLLRVCIMDSMCVPLDSLGQHWLETWLAGQSISTSKTHTDLADEICGKLAALVKKTDKKNLALELLQQASASFLPDKWKNLCSSKQESAPCC